MFNDAMKVSSTLSEFFYDKEEGFFDHLVASIESEMDVNRIVCDKIIRQQKALGLDKSRTMNLSGIKMLTIGSCLKYMKQHRYRTKVDLSDIDLSEEFLDLFVNYVVGE